MRAVGQTDLGGNRNAALGKLDHSGGLLRPIGEQQKCEEHYRYSNYDGNCDNSTRHQRA